MSMRERCRRALYCTLLVVAVVGATAVMTSVVLGDAHWRVGLQVAGLGGSGLSSVALVALVTRWSAADDFWWPDSDR
jgi:hypothetical protein